MVIWSAHNNMTTAMHGFNLISWLVARSNVSNMVHCELVLSQLQAAIPLSGTCNCTVSERMRCALTVDIYRQMDWGSALTSWCWQAMIPHTMLAWQQKILPQCNNLTFCPTSCFWANQIATGLENIKKKLLDRTPGTNKKVNNKEAWQNFCLLGQLY